ncbi:hypothetical protein V8J82_12700 [Gymnodinialimonas sp. 2305UL16-5]|uniref:glycine-rich domain-containing protein n=1 Tax=Gymnodinialimonas mytili TaxID=3126503 RepID=UPI003095B017
MRDPELWARLKAYVFDGPGSAPYSVKLARAEGWDADLTADVIEEYRRFLYLTQISDRQVTPSQMVDAAWHMHLTFTRDYWEDLCPNVIGKQVHHQPCAGDEEMPRYRDQFAATKALYEAEFGAEPPAEIWGRDHHRERTPEGVVIQSHWIVTIALAAALLLYILEPDLPWGVFAFLVIAGFVLQRVADGAARPRRRRRGEIESDVWFDMDGHGGGRRSRRDDHHDTSDGDGGGDDGGGGCGGCGD